MIKKVPLIKIVQIENEKSGNNYVKPFPPKNLGENENSELLNKTLEGYSVVGKSDLRRFKKPNISVDFNNLLQNKVSPRAIPRNLKVKILINSQIRAYLRYCAINQKYPDPQKVLELLSRIKGTKITEEPFVTSNNSKIQNGRKLNVFVGKELKLIFEVHDYRKSDGKVNWIMRLYDDDKVKKSRSYLNQSGSFNRDAYDKCITHINCGENGRRFVMRK